jgi:hypothetical protein
MFPSTTLTRFRRHLLVGAVAAVTIVPAAAAGLTRPPDGQDAASANLVAQLSPPDIRDAALGATAAVPDALERYAIAHPFGTGLAYMGVGVARPPDVQDAAFTASAAAPDVLERYATAHPYGGLSSSDAVVSRPPDISDAALATQYSSSSVSSSSFNWGDWAIGIGTGNGHGMALLHGP